MTLQKLYDKITNIETKVDLIVDYLGVKKRKTVSKQTDYTVTMTAPPVDSGEQIEPRLSNYITPTLKQKAVLLSSSKGNLAKNLLLEMFSPGERKGRNCSGRSNSSGSSLQPHDQDKLGAIKEIIFQQYPDVPPKLQEKVWKEECVKAIDAFLRKERWVSAKKEC